MNFLRMVLGGSWIDHVVSRGVGQMTMFDHDGGGGPKFPKIWPRGIWMAPIVFYFFGTFFTEIV